MTIARFACAGLAALSLLAGGAAAAPAPVRDARVWTAAEAARAGELALLQQLVEIDSGSGDVEGGRRVADVLAARLQAIGMSVQRIPAERPGLADNLVATWAGTGKGRILMIGHLDTVFGPGTAAKRPYRTDATKAYGPGVSDEKGGVVEAVAALEILKRLDLRDFKSITLLVESSEELGSPGTRALIARLLPEADVELNLEPGDEPDRITVWRKGSELQIITVKGRAAHAGVAPQDGRNAALELLHQIEGAADLPRSGDGMTANLTLMSAGTRNNIIPESAEATINVRTRDPAQGPAVLAKLQANARTTVIPDTTVTVRREVSYPPLFDNPATNALAARAQAIYAGLGMTLQNGGNGGASESALAAEAGVPTLDGLGPVGGGFHADAEYILLSSVTPRLYLLTKLLIELGAAPPPRMR